MVLWWSFLVNGNPIPGEMVIILKQELALIDSLLCASFAWWRFDMEMLSTSQCIFSRESTSPSRWASNWEVLINSLLSAWTCCWTNTWTASDLRRHVAHVTSLLLGHHNSDAIIKSHSINWSSIGWMTSWCYSFWWCLHPTLDCFIVLAIGMCKETVKES